MLLARMDEYGKGAWLILTLLAFWAAWPLSFIIFAFLVGSGLLRAWKAKAPPMSGRWSNLRAEVGSAARRSNDTGAGGSDAFDAYRKAELGRLEQEQREFKAYLNRLRLARDKAEFDRFMAERRRALSNVAASGQAGSWAVRILLQGARALVCRRAAGRRAGDPAPGAGQHRGAPGGPPCHRRGRCRIPGAHP